MIITLERFSYAPDGTFGRLTLPCGWSCFTVERPWLDNRPRESCIPDGVYRMSRRRSPVVERTSDGDYLEGWEVCDVPGRSYIMIHPGNWPHNFKGCIGVGRSYAVIQGTTGVSHSRITFAELMGRLDGAADLELCIKPFRMHWNGIVRAEIRGPDSEVLY